MDMRWRVVLCRLSIWVAAEIIFSLLGIDDLADYSEFLWEKDPPVLITQNYSVQ